MADEDLKPPFHLSAKQRKFAELYNGDGVASAIAAGYSAANAGPQASRNLANPRVMEIIRAREKAEVRPQVMTRIQRQAFWSEVAANSELPMRDRLAASKLLGDSEGDFSHVQRVDANVQTTQLPSGLSLEDLRALARGDLAPSVAEEVVSDDSVTDD